MLLPFFTGTFIATPSPEKKIAYKTFFVLKERLAIIWRLLCFVAQIWRLLCLVAQRGGGGGGEAKQVLFLSSKTP